MRLDAEQLEDRLTPSLTTLTSLLDPLQGAAPFGTPVEDSSGNIFGTTQAGGPYGDGTIYEIKSGSSAVTTLAAFNGTNGAQPEGGLIADSHGNLFGTAFSGGAMGDGTVFELASGSSTITTLASFNGTNGANPDCKLLENSLGILYGTTTGGGTFGQGTLFTLPSTGGTVISLASFNGIDGATPIGSLIQDKSGNFYGTAYAGGNGYGTVFEYQTLGSTLLGLALFDGNDGANAQGALVEDTSGDLFGTTAAGGTSDNGTVFELLAGSPFITTLVSFGGTDGASPQAGLIADSLGNLFGTTEYGGFAFTGPGTGYGLLFEVPYGVSTNVTLAEFSGGADGANPVAGLLRDARGNLIGAASSGGVNYGTVFTLQNGSSTITPLADFPGSVGANPYAGLVQDSKGNLFGTTSDGGPFGDGTVFELPQGSGTVTVLAAFNGTSGANPLGNLIIDMSGNLFGTTSAGGASSDGTVFELASGSASITTLASFSGTDGAFPNAGVIEDSSGNLFGTTANGGPGWDPANPQLTGGTVFEVPGGTSTITTLVAFTGANGMYPVSGLMEDKSGWLYGTTVNGGSAGDGTVFKIPGRGGNLLTLASFSSTTGNSPTSTLVEDSNGNLYGTTFYGGPSNDGSLFEVQAAGGLTTLVFFDGTHGANPYAGLLLTTASSLFGVTSAGGPSNDGIIFELPLGGSGVTAIASFNGSNGTLPLGTLMEDSSGNLFGTTSDGGTTDTGTVFELPAAIPVIKTSSLANWTVNQAGYSQTIMAGGGSGTLTFAATGTLPTGLTLSSAGVLAGTPTVTGSYTFAVTATDSLGQTASISYTVIIYPVATALAVSAPTTAVAGTAFIVTITAQDGSGNSAGGYNGTVMLSSSLGSDISPNSVTLTNGTATVPVTLTGAGSQTLSAAAPGLAAGGAVVTVSAAAFSAYQVSIGGSSTVQAGAGILATVQATDRFGNAVTSYTGPASVTPTITPSAGANFPSTVSINGQGLGFFLATLQTAGSYTVSVSSGTYTSNHAGVVVAPGAASMLGFALQPVNTPTGVTLPSVAVQVEDAYGNVITTDNTDIVTLGIASGPGSFTVGSTTTATAHNGVATFNNLTLVKPGVYTLSEVVMGVYTGPVSSSFTIIPLQVVPGSFVGTPSGFSLQFNAPILVNSVTPVLYGQGFGSTAAPPSVTVTGPRGPVTGSLVVNTSANTITFVETSTTTYINTAPGNTPIFPDGVYAVDLSSRAAGSGFQALNSGGGFLDGLGSGTPGSGDYLATFTVNAAASHADVIWVPPTADGPLQPLNAPGGNQINNGYPIYIDDTTGSVTGVQVTVNYNPAMLTVTGASGNSALSGSSFTLLSSSTPGQAVLQYTGSLTNAGNLTGGEVPLGFLMATVPNSSASVPIYRGKDLLHLSGVAVNGGTVPAVGGDALHLVAYVGDADGNGAYSSSDAVLITRVLVATDTGFTAYPLIDPAIVADTDGSGFIPSDAALQANEAGVGFPTANLPSPPIPTGADIFPTNNSAYLLRHQAGSHPSVVLATAIPITGFIVSVGSAYPVDRPIARLLIDDHLGGLDDGSHGIAGLEAQMFRGGSRDRRDDFEAARAHDHFSHHVAEVDGLDRSLELIAGTEHDGLLFEW